jgi:hypothetical protein
MTHWFVRVIPAATLMVTALLFAVVGVLLPFGDAANNGPGSGQIRPGMVAFGAALVVGGAALAWLAWGVWRAGKWPMHIALVVSVSVLACLVWVATQPATLMGSIFDPTTGQLVRQYDTGGQRIAIAIVPYSAAVVCLIAAELRLRTRTA